MVAVWVADWVPDSAMGPTSTMLQAAQAMNASRYGGYSTMMMGQENGPFGGGGCCSPIWYDLEIGWMALQRDERSGVDISSSGIDGPRVLNTADVDGELQHGFHASYSMLVGPSTALELAYFGIFESEQTKNVTGNGDLYSAFSDFGLFQSINPLTGLLQIGFPQTVDAANQHSLTLGSELHNAELNLRRRWVTAGCLLHGSMMAGVRYISLDEGMAFNALVPDGGSLDYNIDTQNDAFGFQVGGEAFVCVSPRFKFGVDYRGGIFGNEARVNSVINTIDVTPGGVTTATPVLEESNETDVAFVGQLSVTALFRVTPRLMIKGGYTMLYLDNFALAGENFSTASPFAATGRPVAFNNESDVLYNGASLGITWTW